MSRLLARAGVSRTAFYSLARRPSVLPESVTAVAAALGASEMDLLEPGAAAEVAARARLRRARRICRALPGLEFENVWHTLVLLERDPHQRLEEALRRGRSQLAR